MISPAVRNLLRVIAWAYIVLGAAAALAFGSYGVAQGMMTAGPIGFIQLASSLLIGVVSIVAQGGALLVLLSIDTHLARRT